MYVTWYVFQPMFMYKKFIFMFHKGKYILNEMICMQLYLLLHKKQPFVNNHINWMVNGHFTSYIDNLLLTCKCFTVF